MTLEEKVAAVTGVFQDLDARTTAFQSSTTLHCQQGCGKCCIKPDIEATVLEFLPLALHLYKHNEAEQWLEKIDAADSSYCMNLNLAHNGGGMCAQYVYRGLICRLFGYSVRTNKYGKKDMVTCNFIKNEQAEAFVLAGKKIEDGLDVPVTSQVYMQLCVIDFDLTRQFYPINKAIKLAIETVLQYYAYRSQEVLPDI